MYVVQPAMFSLPLHRNRYGFVWVIFVVLTVVVTIVLIERVPNPFARTAAQVFRPRVPQEAVQLVAQLLDYTPSKRLRPLEACLHSFFDELRNPDTRLPNDQPLPPLYNFIPYGESSRCVCVCVRVWRQ